MPRQQNAICQPLSHRADFFGSGPGDILHIHTCICGHNPAASACVCVFVKPIISRILKTNDLWGRAINQINQNIIKVWRSAATPFFNVFGIGYSVSYPFIYLLFFCNPLLSLSLDICACHMHINSAKGKLFRSACGKKFTLWPTYIEAETMRFPPAYVVSIVFIGCSACFVVIIHSPSTNLVAQLRFYVNRSNWNCNGHVNAIRWPRCVGRSFE